MTFFTASAASPDVRLITAPVFYLSGSCRLRFSIIGEEGAANLDRASRQNNIDNLAVAKEMLNSGKDAKSIKLATGWEKKGMASGEWKSRI